MYIQQSSFVNQFIFEPISHYITKESVAFVVSSLALCILTVGVGYLIYSHFFKDRKVILLGNQEETLQNKTANRISDQISHSLNRTNVINYEEGLRKECDLLESDSESLAGDYAETIKIDIQKAGNKVFSKAKKEIEENISDKQRSLAIYTAAIEELQTIRLNCKNNFPHNPRVEQQLRWFQTLKQIIGLGARTKYSEGLKLNFARELRKHYTQINTPFIRETLFHFLAKEGGPIQFVETFVRAEAKFNIQDRNGYTPCMLACSKGHDAMALEIIKQGQGKGHNLDIQTEQLSNTMLIMVVGLGYEKGKSLQGDLRLKLVEELISSGASLTKANLKGFNALHIACLRRDPKMTEILLKADPDLIDRKTNKGLKPADMITLGYPKALNKLKNLLESPSELDEMEFNANLVPMQQLLGIA